MGDIVAKAGRNIVMEKIPQLIRQWALDFVIANGENAAHGIGITGKIAQQLFECGVDVITLGNHAFGNPNIVDFMVKNPRILRPHNWSEEGYVGSGLVLLRKRGYRLLVVNLAGKAFMRQPAHSPFDTLDSIFQKYRLQDNMDACVIDIHAEATAEKQAVGQYSDGKVSLVVGTHVHIPTADTRILKGGTGYQTDAGMCGVYDSVIGLTSENSIDRLRDVRPRPSFEPAEGAASLCGVFCEVDDGTGLAQSISPIRIGGDLMEHLPPLG